MALIEVKKAWGKEIQLVNTVKYAAKILCLDKGAYSSVHYHINKDESFYCIKGEALVVVESFSFWLSAYDRQVVRIQPGQRHMFVGLKDAQIIEVSTHDSPEDTYRLTESRPAPEAK